MASRCVCGRSETFPVCDGSHGEAWACGAGATAVGLCVAAGPHLASLAERLAWEEGGHPLHRLDGPVTATRLVVLSDGTDLAYLGAELARVACGDVRGVAVDTPTAALLSMMSRKPCRTRWSVRSRGVDGLENLLLTYAGAMLINAVVSGLLWFQNRTPLHRSLFVVWATSLVAFAIQGAVQTGTLAMVVAFSPVFVIGLALATLIDEMVGVDVPVRGLSLGFLVVYPLATAAWWAGLPFAAVAAPVAIGVVAPMAWVIVQVWRLGRWRVLSLSGRGLIVATAFYALHALDYPFLRDKPEYAAAGFTVAILIIFALSIFAPAAVLEIATKEQARVATELELARHIQVAILPKDPRLEGLQIACCMVPAEEVGGDYYDIYSFGEQSWLLLGDVTGHGLSSGLVMLMAQSTISAILHTRPDISPRELAFTANHILYRNLRRLDEQRTMTFVAITRDSGTGGFCYSGSHENLYVVRARDGSVESLAVGEMPHGLGMLDEFPLDEYGEARFALEPGDVLFIATDGVVEAAPRGDYQEGMYGEERLRSFLVDHRDAPLEPLKEGLLEELRRFTTGVFHDDISFVVVRATG